MKGKGAKEEFSPVPYRKTPLYKTPIQNSKGNKREYKTPLIHTEKWKRDREAHPDG